MTVRRSFTSRFVYRIIWSCLGVKPKVPNPSQHFFSLIFCVFIIIIALGFTVENHFNELRIIFYLRFGFKMEMIDQILHLNNDVTF